MVRHLIALLSLLLIAAPLTAQFEMAQTPVTSSLTDVHFFDTQNGIAVGDSGIILRSTDGGVHWDIQYDNDTTYFTGVKFFDESDGLAFGHEEVFRTEDGGLSWLPVSDLPADDYRDAALLDDSTVIISGRDYYLHRSEDRGMTWSPLPFQPTQAYYGLVLSFPTPLIGYGIGNNQTDHLWKTTDGGFTWDSLPTQSGLDITVIESVDFVSETVGYRGGWYLGHLMVTEDGGHNWSRVQLSDTIWIPFQRQLIDLHILAEQPENYWACGWYGNVFRSLSGGYIWEAIPTGLGTDTRLIGLDFIDADHGWIVGDHGTILYTTNGGGPTATEVPQNPLSFSVFPNPTSGEIHLESEGPLEGKHLRIYDSGGRFITEFPAVPRLDLSHLPAGSYWLEFVGKEDRQVRMILLTE